MTIWDEWMDAFRATHGSVVESHMLGDHVMPEIKPQLAPCKASEIGERN